MNKSPKFDIWRLLARKWPLKLLALALAIAGVVLDHKGDIRGKESIFYEQLTIAVMFVIIVFLVEAIFGLYEEGERVVSELLKNIAGTTGTLNNKVDKIGTGVAEDLSSFNATTHEKLDEIVSLFKGQLSSHSVMKASSQYGGVVGKVLGRMHADQMNMVELFETGFSINGADYVIPSYIKFWEELVEVNREWKKNHGTGLTVEITQSTDIKVWNNSALDAVYVKQAQFCRDGGKITRIICGNGPEPDKKYRAIAAKMIFAKVDVAYYNMGVGFPGVEDTWDFLVVKEINIAAIWDSIDARHNIRKAIFTRNAEYKGLKLTEIWATLFKHAMLLDPISLPQFAEDWPDKGDE